jgi:hypothetical protein
MAVPSRPSLLRRLIGLPSAEPEEDAADMGTAIGLDFSMDQASASLDEGRPDFPKSGSSRPARPGWRTRRRTD